MNIAKGLVALLVIGMPIAGAQTSRTVPETEGAGEGIRSTAQPSVIQPAQRGMALESTIDPARYFVGPSDVIAVNVWTSPPIAQILTVTPEGTLIIPLVGEVRVADMSLADAKKEILAVLRRRFRMGEMSVTLVTPRPLLVTLTGNVLNPGTYTLAAHYRVDKAIEEANKPQRGQDPTQADYYRQSSSRRSILVKSKTGAVSRVDLMKFFATKDDRWNPYLREGDLIIVPRNEMARGVVGAYGEFNAPGRFEFVDGDSISDLVRLAHGFTPQAIEDSLELTSFDAVGESIHTRSYDARAIMAGSAPNVALQPGDRVVVRAKADVRADFRVVVRGEVRYPGTYPISKNHTRLSEIMSRVGGFTESASVRNANLVRHSIDPREIEIERMESLRGGVSAEDSAYYYLETSLRMQKELVQVDFGRLFLKGDSTADVVLQNNDEIVIPAVQRTIYVFGQVVAPGHVPFQAGLSVEHYIVSAGGFTGRARSGDVKIVKARTRQWLSPDETVIEEGDYVWVPKNPEHPFAYYVNVIGQAAAIVSAAVSIVLLVVQLNK